VHDPGGQRGQVAGARQAHRETMQKLSLPAAELPRLPVRLVFEGSGPQDVTLAAEGWRSRSITRRSRPSRAVGSEWNERILPSSRRGGGPAHSVQRSPRRSRPRSGS
jgi:hypothetical protein